MGTSCPNCGLENTAGRTICKQCRAPLQSIEQAQSDVAVSEQPQATVLTVIDRPIRARARLKLWLVWTLATTASGIVIGILQQSSACEGAFLALFLLPVLFCAGIGLGVAQWLVLRHTVTIKLWIPATGIGSVLAGATFLSITGSLGEFLGADRELWDLLPPEQTQFPGILMFGLVLGTAQALVLRRITGAMWWVPASIAGVILATLGLASVHDALAQVRIGYCGGLFRGIAQRIAIVTSAELGAIVGSAIGLGIGVLTGGVLVWLLRPQPIVAPSGSWRIAQWLSLPAALGLVGASLALWYPSVRVMTMRLVQCRYTGPTNAYGMGKIYGQPSEQDPLGGWYQPPDMLCSSLTAANAQGRWRWVRATYQTGWVLESYLQISDAGAAKLAQSSLPSQYELWRIDEGLGAVSRVGFSSDGRSVFAASEAAGLQLWDIDRTQVSRRLGEPSSDVLSVALSPDGGAYLIAQSDAVQLIDAESGREIRRFDPSGDPDARITDVIFSPDGHIALAATTEGYMRLWDITSGQETQELLGHERITGVVFSPDGHTILAGKFGRGLEIWDVASGQELRHFGPDKYRITSLAISSDGKLALSGSTDGVVRLWDMVSGRELRHFSGHTDSVTTIAFCPDGRRFLTGAADTTLRLWDVASGQELRLLEGHTNALTSVACSPDGRTALSGSWDGTLRLWRID